jgi:hypothetical protein
MSSSLWHHFFSDKLRLLFLSPGLTVNTLAHDGKWGGVLQLSSLLSQPVSTTLLPWDLDGAIPKERGIEKTMRGREAMPCYRRKVFCG